MALVGDDCFFFLNAGCVRGSQCTFRHQPAARSTTVVCPQWLQRCCFHPNCVLRHTDDVVSRQQTPCYYESNMGVCWKPRCAFGHLRKTNGPPRLPVLPPHLPVLPPSLPVLPAMPPVLPAMPPVLPATVGITPVPPPRVLDLTLSNNTPIIVEKPLAILSNGNVNSMPQVVVRSLSPPALPPPAKLTEMLIGIRPRLQLVPDVKDAIRPHLEQQPQIRMATVPPVRNVSIGATPAVFPKNEHFNEQVRLFKEMLAGKVGAPSQKKHKEDGYSDEEKSGGTHKVKERQRNKKERKEKDGYKSHKSNKANKEVWSKGDEEILYGDYKDVPLDKKSKKKKHKEHKEHADSDPEIKIKSYEEILREKALRKLYSKRKEKFNEDFKELVSENLIKMDAMDDIAADKSNRKNDVIADKVIRKSKKYNSDGDENGDVSIQEIEKPKRRHSKSEDTETSKEANKHEEKRSQKKCDDVEHHSNNSNIKDSMLRNSPIDSESKRSKSPKKADSESKRSKSPKKADSESKRSKSPKKASKRRNYTKFEVNEVTNKHDLIEQNTYESRKEEKVKLESSIEEESSDDDESEETDSEPDSESSEEVQRKNEEIIIPDETTNIDFTVDHDDDLAKEMNRNEQSEIVTKTKKMSSVVSIINKPASVATTFDKNKYHKKTKEREIDDVLKSSNGRHHKPSDSKCNDRDNLKSSDSKKSNEKDHRRKSPKISISNKIEKPIEHKKVVRLVNASGEADATGRVSPLVIALQDTDETPDKNLSLVKSSIVKVKTFEEIMAEKHRRNNNHHSVNLITDSPDVVSIIADSPGVSKSLSATLKEKSLQAKLEILNVPKSANGNSSASMLPSKSLFSKSKLLSDEEKQKRKSLQLYKPPHPVKVETELVVKSAEVKLVVNTGSRKIIRIRKAALSTDLIDQSIEEITETPSVLDEGKEKDPVKVRSFEDIIREKRLRQKKERESHNRMEKENSSSNETPLTSNSDNLCKRKPVIRRQVPVTNSALPVSTCSLSRTFADVPSVLSNTTTTTNNTDLTAYLNTVSESKRPISVDSNIAKVSPLKVSPQKRLKSDSASVHVVTTQAESLENKDFYSKLRSFSSRRTSVSSHNNTAKECEKSSLGLKLGKRRVSSVESSPIASNHVTTHKVAPYTFGTPTQQSASSNEAKVEYHNSSRKDIQEALDEERRKREEDLLSDDEFEKEINELGSDYDDEDFDDMNEDDLMMELEQMIDG